MAGMTKEIIIQTVMELLNERPFTKITVKDIVERCGINRNTFYYHFRDITDVMEYAFKRELDRIMQAKPERETHPSSDDSDPLQTAEREANSRMISETDRKIQTAEREANSRMISGTDRKIQTARGEAQGAHPAFRLDDAAEDIYDGLMKVAEMLKENRRAILHIYRYMDRAVLQHQLDTLCEYIVSNYVLRADVYPDIRKLSGEDQRLLRNFQKCILEGVLLDWLEHGMKEDLSLGMKRVLELMYEASGADE